MPLPIQRLQGRIRIPAPGRPGQVLSVLKVDFGAWAGIASGAAKVRLRVREPPTGCARLAILPALPAAAQSDAGKTLRLAPHADLSIVDPHFSGVYITRNFGYLVYDTLLAFDHEFQPRPQMVDTWQVSDDKLTYTFRLRDGLKFHDGQPVRAADAVASLSAGVNATTPTASRCLPRHPRSRRLTTGKSALC